MQALSLFDLSKPKIPDSRDCAVPHKRIRIIVNHETECACCIRQLTSPSPDSAGMNEYPIGAHLVDTPPLSTLGSIGIARAGEHDDKQKLLRNLLFQDLSMSVVGAVICRLFFGIISM